MPLSLRVFESSGEMAQRAARHAAESLRQLLATGGSVRLLAATGASQLQFLDALAREPGLDWKQVELFHLDEYVGIGRGHPASFARYIKERIIDRFGIVRFHLLDGTRDPLQAAAEMSALIAEKPVNLAFVGIGENGHLAFNDPPADFETAEPYLVVELDDACRSQQVSEGWFASLDDVPPRAITISIPQLLKTREILCVVPDRRKAQAVQRCLEQPISPWRPASALRSHPNATIYLDRESASLLARTEEPS